MNVHGGSVFTWRVRVYYEDTDTGGVVFYANYLKFFERARTEWLRTAGVSQQALLETDHAMFVVKSTAVDYHAPARLDDEIDLTVRIERLGRVSVEFIQQAWRVGAEPLQLIALGKIRVACIDANSFRPVAIPEHVLAAIRIHDEARDTCPGGLTESAGRKYGPPEDSGPFDASTKRAAP